MKPKFSDAQAEATRRQLGPLRRDWFLIGADRALSGFAPRINPSPGPRAVSWMGEGYEWARLALQTYKANGGAA
jgi:hypothetical protein